MASHPNKRSQLVQPKPKIIAAQTKIPRMGTTGTQGVVNSLFKSGSVLRKTITEIHTKMKANKVPILVMSPTISPGTKPANAPTKSIIIKLAL